jgi:hypothetical protein
LIGVPVAGPGYDVEAFARDSAAFGKQAGKPIVISAPQRSVADQFASEGLSVFTTETEAVTAQHQYLAHRELMARTRSRRAQRAAAPRPLISSTVTTMMLDPAAKVMSLDLNPVLLDSAGKGCVVVDAVVFQG